MSIALLDEIRRKSGYENMKNYFNSTGIHNKREAVGLINDVNLKFPSLFLLRTQFSKLNISGSLNIRNQCALKIVNDVLFKETSTTGRFLREYQRYYYVLKWILETGYPEDGLSDQYDEVLDTAAIMLAKVYNDRKCLPIMEELIFNRNRRGAFIYDLEWAFFECLNPEDLVTLAYRLQSENIKDRELAQSFLNFIPGLGLERQQGSLDQFQYALDWIARNKDYLYYTGETHLQCDNPCRYAIAEQG